MEQGASIGQWRLLRRMGRGSLGDTWQAQDETRGRVVALKLLHEAVGHDAGLLLRLKAAVTQAKSLEHPGIVRSYTMAEAGERYYIISEFVDAPALVIRQPLAVDEACRVAVTAADALAYAHGQQLIHANLKPSNILIPNTGTVRLTDFGQQAPLAHDRPSPLLDIISLYGNAAYLAPELVRGSQPTAASDCYALGLILYAMLAGHPAFSGDNPSLVQQQLLDYPPPLPDLRPDVPAPLLAIVGKAISKDAAARYTDMSTFAAALRDFFIPWYTEQLANNHTSQKPIPQVANTEDSKREVPPPRPIAVNDSGEGGDVSVKPKTPTSKLATTTARLDPRRFSTSGVTRRLTRRNPPPVIVPRPADHIKGPTLPTRTLSGRELNAQRNRRWLFSAVVVLAFAALLLWLLTNIKP